MRNKESYDDQKSYSEDKGGYGHILDLLDLINLDSTFAQ